MIPEMTVSAYHCDSREILVRLKKMEGQIKGIRKMVEEGKYCVDVLNQLYSIIAATEKLAGIILKDHIQGCVRDALLRSDRSEDYVNELVTVVTRYSRK